MRISDVARAAGCSVRAVRHLHDTGAVPEPARTSGNYRNYSVSDLAAIIRARALIDAGVPVADVTSPDAIERSLALIGAKLSHLTRQRDRLTALKDSPVGTPTDITRGLLQALGDTDYTRREIESFDLMALTGVATEATWDQLRANLTDEECVAATAEFARVWEAGDVDKLRELLPRTIMRDVHETLVPGTVPVTVHDVDLPDAQRVALEALAGEFNE